jgi:hypothetical protein
MLALCPSRTCHLDASRDRDSRRDSHLRDVSRKDGDQYSRQDDIDGDGRSTMRADAKTEAAADWPPLAFDPFVRVTML